MVDAYMAALRGGMEEGARCNVASTVTEQRAIEGMELASLDA